MAGTDFGPRIEKIRPKWQNTAWFQLALRTESRVSIGPYSPRADKPVQRPTQQT